MFEIWLLDFFRVFLPAVLFAFVCVISLLHFSKIGKKGHLITSIGFILLTAGWLVIPLFVDYLQIHIISPFRSWEFYYLLYAVFYVLSALLILIGFFLLKDLNKNNSRSGLPPPKGYLFAVKGSVLHLIATLKKGKPNFSRFQNHRKAQAMAPHNNGDYIFDTFAFLSSQILI